jgi:hypothetical protein
VPDATAVRQRLGDQEAAQSVRDLNESVQLKAEELAALVSDNQIMRENVDRMLAQELGLLLPGEREDVKVLVSQIVQYRISCDDDRHLLRRVHTELAEKMIMQSGSDFAYSGDDIAAISRARAQLVCDIAQLRELIPEVEGGGESDGEVKRDGLLLELKKQRNLLQKEHDEIHQLELYNDRLSELVSDAKRRSTSQWTHYT